MRRSIRLLGVALVTLAVVSMTASAFAQRGGGPGGRGGERGGPGGRGPGGGGPPGGMRMAGPIGGMLQNPQLREHLELSEEQVEKLRATMEEIGQRMREQMEGMRDLSPEQRRERFEKMREEMEKVREEIQGKIRDILSSEQVAKVQTLMLQQMGGLAGALRMPETLEVLDLSEEQMEKMESISGRVSNAAREMFEGVDFRNMTDEDRQQFREKMEALRDKGVAAAEKVLNDEQKTKLEEIVAGEPAVDLRPNRGDRRGGERQWRPGENSWRPGQGVPGKERGPEAGNRGRGGRQGGGRGFPPAGGRGAGSGQSERRGFPSQE